MKAAPLPNVLAFGTKNGTPMRSSNWIRRDFADILKAAKIKDCTIHPLGYTFCGHILTNGLDVRSAASIVGHSKPSTLLEIYAKGVVSPHIGQSVENLHVAR